MIASDYYVFRVNDLVSRFDRDLFCKRSPDGVVKVCQRTRDGEHFVFALTEGFRSSGQPVEWGVEPILHKLHEISFDNRERIREEMRKEREESEASSKRQRMRSFEDMASELRPMLNKSMGNVLTHSMDMSKDPRRKYERTKKCL